MKKLLVLPFLLLLLSHCSSQQRLMDFSPTASDASWSIVNDDVMGGRSSAQLKVSGEGHAVWTGAISLENNGGFASIRSPQADYKLANHTGLKIRIKGDGRKYGFTLSTTRYFNGISYSSYFETQAGEWQEFEVPFSSFVGKMLGREMASIDPLDADQIKEIGVILYDGKSGDFAVEIDWVDVY